MYSKLFKRVLDMVLSLLALVVLLPILAVLSVIGAIAMKGNPFFTQLRPGLKNKKTGKEQIFRLIKFRTMSNAKDENGNLLPDDVRLNGYGKFLRSTSLDELPELINILKGDMSIIGPRPQLVRDMVFMTDVQRMRHNVRPGLSGLAQVSGRNNITWEEKFEYDLKYIEKVSFITDAKLVALTVVKVFKREDTVREGTVSDVDFGDWLVMNGEITQEEYYEKQIEARELFKVLL
ncbi:MAG: sugar transferase [Ruminococcaceae bacterium]|nr:sugar transferase [Oscillospiraceae bacterium]